MHETINTGDPGFVIEENDADGTPTDPGAGTFEPAEVDLENDHDGGGTS